MPLDRKSVERGAAEHVRTLRRAGARVDEARRRAIRKLHERSVEKVACRAKR